MARQKNQSGCLYIFLFILFSVVSAFNEYAPKVKAYFLQNLNTITLVSYSVFFLIIFFAIVKLVSKRIARKKWLKYLYEKYNDNEEIIQQILEGNIWVGQTDEQLLDSIGTPVAVDEQVLKTKKKEIWKYGHIHSNNYKLRITLENDRVTAWDQKS